MNDTQDKGLPLAASQIGGRTDAAKQHSVSSHAGPAGTLSGMQQAAIAVGEKLAAAREEKQRTVDEMASRLKVPPMKVRALESGNLSSLHDAAFAVGLVRSYAKVLGIDPEPLTDALRGTRSDTPDLSLPQSTLKSPSMRRAHVPLSWSTRRSDRRSWIWGGLAAVVVLLLLVVWRVGNEPNGWLQHVKKDAASDVLAENPAAAQGASGGTVSADLPVTGALGASAPMGVAEANNTVTAALSAPSQALAAAASDVGSAAAATLAAVSGVQSAGPATPTLAANSPSNTALAPGASRLTIHVSQDSWMSIKGSDGKSAYSGVAHAGQSVSADGIPPFRIVIGNMGGVASIDQNGTAVDLKKYSAGGKNVARFTLP